MSKAQALPSALQHFQTIFPNLPIPKYDSKCSNLESLLNSLTHSLPLPSQCSFNSTLTTMRQIMDEQQYKYQLSLIAQSQQTQLLLFDDECYYEQGSTGLMEKKQTGYTDCSEMKQQMVDDVWNWKEEKEIENVKEEFFSFLD